MTLSAVKTAAAIAAAEHSGVADCEAVQAELAAFIGVLARERCTDRFTVVGQLIVAAAVAEGFALALP